VKARFNVSIAEVADNDLWQKATLGIAAVANEHAFAQESISKVVRFIEELYVAPVTGCATEVVPLGGDLFGDSSAEGSFGAVQGSHRTLAEAEAEEEGREPEEPIWSEASRERPAGRRAQRPLSEAERQRAIDDLRERLRSSRRRPEPDGDEE